jgi:signal peptidase I
MSTEDEAKGETPETAAYQTAPADQATTTDTEHFQAAEAVSEPVETVAPESEAVASEAMAAPDAAPEEPMPIVPEAPGAAESAPSAAEVSAPAAVEEDEQSFGDKAKNEIVEIGKTIFFALLIAFVLRVVLFQPFTIPSASMEPNLYQGDYIIVTKWSYGWSHYSIPGSPKIFSGRLFGSAPKRGDIVVFRLPREDKIDYIKRVIGLPGDTIQVHNNQLYINGKPTKDVPKGPVYSPDNPFGTDAVKVQETLPNGKVFMSQDYGPNNAADNTAVYTVPKGCYFMMGDNRDDSVDSRFDPQVPVFGAVQSKCAWDPSVDAALGPAGSQPGVGFVPAENLIGKAQIIMFSWYAGASLWNPVSWFSKVRFNRWFHGLK